MRHYRECGTHTIGKAHWRKSLRTSCVPAALIGAMKSKLQAGVNNADDCLPCQPGKAAAVAKKSAPLSK